MSFNIFSLYWGDDQGSHVHVWVPVKGDPAGRPDTVRYIQIQRLLRDIACINHRAFDDVLALGERFFNSDLACDRGGDLL